MKTSPQDYVTSGAHLPKPLRDFHDAKDVFKAMHSAVAVDKNAYAKDISWVAGQCYVIDIFLWFMAKRGWTLQRSRAHVDFLNLEDDIKARQEAETAAFKQFMETRKDPTKVPADATTVKHPII
jgi:hypothetical protein